MKKNRVYAGIDLDALRYNMESMHKNIKEGTKIAAVIKADAYGHGALTAQKQSRTFRMYGDLPWQLRMKRRC